MRGPRSILVKRYEIQRLKKVRDSALIGRVVRPFCVAVRLRAF